MARRACGIVTGRRRCPVHCCAADGLLQRSEQIAFGSVRHRHCWNAVDRCRWRGSANSIGHETRGLPDALLICLEPGQDSFIDKQLVHFAIEMAEVVDDVTLEQFVKDQFYLDIGFQ